MWILLPIKKKLHMGGSSRTCIWIFNKTLKKKCFKKKFSLVPCALHKEHSACLGTGPWFVQRCRCCWNKPLRDLFLGGKPRQQVAPAPRLRKTAREERRRKQTSITVLHSCILFPWFCRHFLKWPLKKNSSVLRLVILF